MLSGARKYARGEGLAVLGSRSCPGKVPSSMTFESLALVGSPLIRRSVELGWPACYREGFGGTSLDSDARWCAALNCVNRSWQARRALQRVAAPCDRQRRLEDQTGGCADSAAYSALTRYVVSTRVWYGALLCRRISLFSQGSVGRGSPQAPDVARTPRIRGRPGNVRLGYEA